MKIADPLALKVATPKEAVVFAASQLQGKRQTQEDFFINFSNECFVVADGVGGMPHGEVAAKLAAQTAIWGYKLIRQRPFYWLDKRLFMRRIFRSTNITLWQKRRETGFEEGMATTLDVLIVGERNFWVGHVGDGSVWFLPAGRTISKLTTDDADAYGYLTKVLGTQRYGLVPQFVSGRLAPGDTILLATDGVTSVLQPEAMETIMEESGQSTDSLTNAVLALVKKAEREGSEDNMTAVLVKRIASP